MNRLEFMKKGAAVAATTVVASVGLAGVVSTLTGCSESKPVSDKIIGLQLYSLRDAMGQDVPGTLKKVADMGYKSLETAGYDNGKIYGYDPAEFRKMVEALGMTVTGAHLGRSYSEAEDAEAMAWWATALDAQKAAGCKYVIQASFPIGEKIEDIQLYCDYFNKVGKMARDRGMRFGFHNHAGEFAKIDDKVIFDYMIENTNPEDVFFELDVYWAVKGGVDPVAYINKYPGRFPVLHIKDDSIIGESGEIDFEPIFNAGYANGMEDFFVEVERYTLPAENCVARSFDFLNVSPCVKCVK